MKEFIKALKKHYKGITPQPVLNIESNEKKTLIVLSGSCRLDATFNKLISVFNNYQIDIKPAYKGAKRNLFYITINE